LYGAAKRGNGVYCYRLENRFNELLPLSTYPEFFEPEDIHKVQSSPLLFVSLTVNPAEYSADGILVEHTALTEN